MRTPQESGSMREDARLDAWEQEIGRVCDRPDCPHCVPFLAAARELAAAQSPSVPHGTNGYNNYDCRCRYCRIMHRLAARVRHERMSDDRLEQLRDYDRQRKRTARAEW